jgi:hypothetical protein
MRNWQQLMEQNDKANVGAAAMIPPSVGKYGAEIEAHKRRAGERGITWAGWKAAALNRLFKEQGTTGQTGRITAETIRLGEGMPSMKTTKSTLSAPEVSE